MFYQRIVRMKTKQLVAILDRLRFWLASTLDQHDRPRILMLADKRNWAFDHSARQIRHYLEKDFMFDIRYVHEKPKLSPKAYDLAYIFFWGEDYHQQFGFDIDRTIKEVSSHRWQDDPLFGPCTTASEMVVKYLNDAATVICTSKRLLETVRSHHVRVYYTPNGIDPIRFKRVRDRSGPLTIGWAGNIDDSVKGVSDIVKPACEGRFHLLLASGGHSHEAMNEFYNGLDVIVVASKHEGEPLTLLEAMAAGCFPVCTNVGIVPELVRHGENGLIIRERTVEAFRAAFEWCKAHLDQVRKVGLENAALVHKERNWQVCAQFFKRAFLETLKHARRPRFRNDDVSADTSLERFREFCAIFQKYGLNQVHGITLRGQTNSYFEYEGDSVEYEGLPNVAKLPNSLIRKLSDDLHFEERKGLVDYLRESPDEIALHGLYHTDYSAMSEKEQLEEMTIGLAILHELFPAKRVRYFIAPFNRTNPETYRVAGQLGLRVLEAEGVHLEERLQDLRIKPETWYRYHHHRFYPESTYRYSDLSLELLDKAFSKNCEKLAEDLPMRQTKG